MVSVSAFTAMMCVLTVVFPSVPLSALNVSVTLQTLVVMMAGIMLRPAEAFLSMVLYITIGIIVLPVFSNYQSGPSVLAGPTGGFILAFPLAAFLIACFRGDRSFLRLTAVNIIFGVALVYLAGAVSLSLVMSASYFNALSGLAAFFLPDCAKALLAAGLGSKIKEYLKQTG